MDNTDPFFPYIKCPGRVLVCYLCLSNCDMLEFLVSVSPRSLCSTKGKPASKAVLTSFIFCWNSAHSLRQIWRYKVQYESSGLCSSEAACISWLVVHLQSLQSCGFSLASAPASGILLPHQTGLPPSTPPFLSPSLPLVQICVITLGLPDDLE